MGISADPRRAAELIGRAYDLAPADEISEVARGAMGRVWRLVGNGSAYAVKELFWTTPEELLAGTAEAEVQEEVAFREAAAATGIRAPADLRTTEGRYLYDLPPDPGGIVRVATWAEGEPPTTRTPGRANWIGTTLGRLHALGIPAGGRTLDPWYTTAPERDRWLAIAAKAASAGEAWAEDFRQRIPCYVEMSKHICAVDPDEMILTHTDLHPQNALVDGHGRYTLLDWQIEPQRPASGLASAMIDWHVRDGEVDERAVRETLRAYRAAGGTATPSDLADFQFAGFLNYVATQAELALDDAAPTEHRAHAYQVIASHLSRPMIAVDPPATLGTYEKILRLCRPC